MSTDTGTGGGADQSTTPAKSFKTPHQLEMENKGRISSYVMLAIGYLILLAGIVLMFKYLHQANAINDMGYTSRKALEDVQVLYYMYAWIYPLSGLFSFVTINVIYAIYVKLYPQPERVKYDFKVDEHVGLLLVLLELYFDGAWFGPLVCGG